MANKQGTVIISFETYVQFLSILINVHYMALYL